MATRLHVGWLGSSLHDDMVGLSKGDVMRDVLIGALCGLIGFAVGWYKAKRGQR